MSELHEIQLYLLEMLKDIADICEKNNIKYSLSDGTLLGAVRHNGFIPWDDDIDIMMEWDEYVKFIKIAPIEFGDKYFLQNCKTEKEYWLPWSKVRANNTTSMPKKDFKWNIHWGICIDVFPVIGMDKDSIDKQERIYSFNNMLLMDKYIEATDDTYSFTKKQRFLYSIPRGIRRLIYKLLEKKYIKGLGNSKWCCELCRLRRLYPKSIFHDYTVIRFEDRDFMAIKDYDTYLKIQYGDYMTPPPVDEQKGHALELGDIIFDTQRSYSDYKNELVN